MDSPGRKIVALAPLEALLGRGAQAVALGGGPAEAFHTPARPLAQHERCPRVGVARSKDDRRSSAVTRRWRAAKFRLASGHSVAVLPGRATPRGELRPCGGRLEVGAR